jgi:hypothetical protein
MLASSSRAGITIVTAGACAGVAGTSVGPLCQNRPCPSSKKTQIDKENAATISISPKPNR